MPTRPTAVRVLLVTADLGSLLLERDPEGFTVPTLSIPASSNPEVGLLAALRADFGSSGRVASLLHGGADADGDSDAAVEVGPDPDTVPTYVVRLLNQPDAATTRLQAVAASAPASLAALDLRPRTVGGLVRRHGDVSSLLGARDLREDGRGHAPLAAVAVRAAVRAARAVRETVAGGVLEVDTKLGVHDLVTTADRAAEAAAITEIRRFRPEDAILAEESGEHPGSSGVEWIIDPVDGTGNFVLGRADHAVSVAAYRGGTALAAVIHRPADGAWAATGEDGPTGNLPLACTGTGSLRRALVSLGFPHDPARRLVSLRLLEYLFPHVRDFRRTGSACCDQLAVATGTLDAYIGVDLGRWDYAAGVALVAAAGGAAEEIDLGDGSRAVVAAAPGIAEELLKLLRAFPGSPA